MLLLANVAFIPFLFEGLFLSPPADTTDKDRDIWQKWSGAGKTATSISTMTFLQDMFAECLAQMALFPPGKEALLHNKSVLQVLHQLVEDGWSEKAKDSGRAALLALSDKENHSNHDYGPQDNKHIMMSCT